MAEKSKNRTLWRCLAAVVFLLIIVFVIDAFEDRSRKSQIENMKRQVELAMEQYHKGEQK